MALPLRLTLDIHKGRTDYSLWGSRGGIILNISIRDDGSQYVTDYEKHLRYVRKHGKRGLSRLSDADIAATDEVRDQLRAKHGRNVWRIT